AAAVAGGPDERAGFGGLRRRLRPAERGPAAGPPGRPAAAARRVRHPAAARRPPARAGAAGPAARPARGRGRRGGAGAAPAAGGPLARRVADRGGVPVWAAAVGALEGGRLPVAGAGARGAGQGGGGRGRGLPQALHAGDQRRRAERAAGGGAVRRPLPAGGRLPRPQGAAGLGGVPGLDEEPGRADHAGAVRDADAAAAAATAAAGGGGGGLGGGTARGNGQGGAGGGGRGGGGRGGPRAAVDGERLVRQHRGAIQRLLSDWLESEGQAGKAVR